LFVAKPDVSHAAFVLAPARFESVADWYAVAGVRPRAGVSQATNSRTQYTAGRRRRNMRVSVCAACRQATGSHERATSSVRRRVATPGRQVVWYSSA